MKMPTFAPLFVCLYPLLAERARDLGYTLAVHGTVLRDFDLIAVPWTEEAVDPTVLHRALLDTMRISNGDATDGAGKHMDEPEAKPHGRLAWTYHLGAGCVVDLSIVARGGGS